MAQRLAGKKILITAAGQGIGKACALACVAEGAQVIASDINEQALTALAAEANVAIRVLNVRDSAAVTAAADELGALDGLINVAGFVHHGSILECSEEDWAFSFDLNVTAMYRVIKAFLPAMLAAGGGAIVNMASVAGSLKGVPNRCVYGSSKAAVVGLTKSVALDFISQGIRCNAICPGTVQSPSLDERINAFDDPVAARKNFVDRQPLGRLGTAEEIAALAVYLAADESAYTTGSIIVIDGGLTI